MCGMLSSISRRSEEHTSELQSPCNLVCRLLLEKKNKHQDPDLLTARNHRAVRRVNPARRPGHRPGLRRLRVRDGSHPVPAPLDGCFLFNDTATTEIYTLSLHDALPIYTATAEEAASGLERVWWLLLADGVLSLIDRKSTRLNSSHLVISYAVFCLK